MQHYFLLISQFPPLFPVLARAAFAVLLAVVGGVSIDLRFLLRPCPFWSCLQLVSLLSSLR